MKKWLFGFIVSCIVVFSMTTTAVAQNKHKTLIVYYSLTGNTDFLAKTLQKKTDADLFRIETLLPYPTERSELMKTIKKEQETKKFPVLKSLPQNLDTYDQIFIGGPVWFSTVPPPVLSLLKQIDFKGKKVAPFCTCGSKAGKFFSHFKKQVKNAKLVEGLELCNPKTKNPEILDESLNAWLNKINK